MINLQFCEHRARKASYGGFPKPKYIEFCETMLNAGFQVDLYEARRTVSKYVTVYAAGKEYKVRFSNHKPIREREARGDCDFFVGKTNYATTNTAQAVKATLKFFGRNDI